MSKNNKNKLVPRLRFPGFSKYWEVKPVSEMCVVFKGSPLSKADLVENGSVKCIHYGELFTKYSEVISTIYSKTNRSDGFKSEVGDVLMPSSDVTPDGLAKASALMLDGVILGGDMNILRPKKDINPIFLSYLLNHSKRDIIKLVSGTTVKHIYPSQISILPLPIVNDISEQQKIASCLSSLDEVIAGERQKLELLQQHKKGLLQQLFPQEGETVPRLRFPEFQNAGEWEVKKLGEVFDFQEGFPFSSRDLTDNKENAKQVVRITEINNHNKNAEKVYVPNKKIEELSIEYYKVTKGDLLLSLTGAAGFNFFIWNGEEAYLNQRNVKFIPKDKINKAILFLIEPLIHKKINLMGTGQNNNLSKEALKDVLLLIPKLPEQQKIASCLSSLDDLITAQTQKIELLEQHKKGLVQGLFPMENE
jgi:type I restriction enzyme S subunit